MSASTQPAIETLREYLLWVPAETEGGKEALAALSAVEADIRRKDEALVAANKAFADFVEVKLDGDQWCAYLPGFTDLMECEAGFGDTPTKAVVALYAALTPVSPSEEGMTFCWLVERGQPEGQKPTVWIDRDQHASWYGGWTTNPLRARRFPSREEAEAFIKAHLVTSNPGLAYSARAVEHGFLSSPSEPVPQQAEEEQ